LLVLFFFKTPGKSLTTDKDSLELDFHPKSKYISISSRFEEVQKAELVGKYYDYGIDTDGNGKYDYLAINVSLSVTVPGTYQVQIENLLDPMSQVIPISNETSSTLASGIHNVTVKLRTAMIFISKRDGPYTLGYVELTDTSTYTQLGYASRPYKTHLAYRYTDFNPPGARLTGKYYDIGLDTTGNGIYNYLLIIVTLNVTEPGNYDVVVDVHTSTGAHLIQNNTFGYMTNGIQNVSIWLNGATIYENQEDGPYQIDDAAVYDEMGYYHDYYDYTFLDWQKQPHKTKDYSFNEFEVGVNATTSSNILPPESRWGRFISALKQNAVSIMIMALGILILTSGAIYIKHRYRNDPNQPEIKSKSLNHISKQKKEKEIKPNIERLLTIADTDFSTVQGTSPILLQEKFKKLNGNMIEILFVLLENHPTPLTHSNLAVSSGLGKSTLTYSLTRLEELEFIYRHPWKEDFRFIEIGLAPQGIELVTILRQRIENHFLG